MNKKDNRTSSQKAKERQQWLKDNPNYKATKKEKAVYDFLPDDVGLLEHTAISDEVIEAIAIAHVRQDKAFKQVLQETYPDKLIIFGGDILSGTNPHTDGFTVRRKKLGLKDMHDQIYAQGYRKAKLDSPSPEEPINLFFLQGLDDDVQLAIKEGVPPKYRAKPTDATVLGKLTEAEKKAYFGEEVKKVVEEKEPERIPVPRTQTYQYAMELALEEQRKQKAEEYRQKNKK